MKELTKQQQFNIAVKKRRPIVVMRLLSDSEIDPTENNNVALFNFLGNWKVFSILKDHKKINPYVNYEENLLNSIFAVYPKNENKVFTYLSKNELFKEHISTSVLCAIRHNVNIVKEIYKNEWYRQSQKEKDFNAQVSHCILSDSYKSLDFLLKENPKLEISIKRDSVNYSLSENILKVIVSDSRFFCHFNINFLFKEVLFKEKYSIFNMLLKYSVNYNKDFVFEILLKKNYWTRVEKDELNKIFSSLAIRSGSIDIIDHLKTKEIEAYEIYRKELLLNKVSCF
jgi:hypothetical protein